VTLGELIDQRRTIVCAGTGGVGKTTTAAVLAIEAARRGRRAVVVTIDPAKRLADALGLEGLGNTPTRVEGDWPGELSALMLDTPSTFDDLVRRNATRPEQAERILENRFYRNISGALSGTQEFMAAEKLHELHEDDAFDLVVVDTPPSRRALDFLDAPRRLTAFLDHSLFRAVVTPTRAYLKVMNVATKGFLKAAGKVVGGDAVEEGVDFFQAFEGMEQGFRDRAARVDALLRDPATAYVLVASPRADTVTEAMHVADFLAGLDLPVAALVVNRVHPRFGDGPVPSRTDGLHANLADLRTIADGEERHFETLARRVAPAPVARVPLLVDDVHDLGSLAEVAAHLF
jgi:anion-transporting  ArsA/GET3 family ATPase